MIPNWIMASMVLCILCKWMLMVANPSIEMLVPNMVWVTVMLTALMISSSSMARPIWKVCFWKPNASDPKAGTGKYGSCCTEIDIWEANQHNPAFTMHSGNGGSQTRCEGSECEGSFLWCVFFVDTFSFLDFVNSSSRSSSAQRTFQPC